jgi:tetratricopeptide (TPR) repeat protein
MPEKIKESSKPSRLEVEFLEALRRRCPAHEPILEALGHLYTRAGRFQDGLQVDLELTRLRPDDSESWYNLACSLALTQQHEPAMASLRKAVACGYDDADWMQNDDDLATLRDHPDFLALLAMLREGGPSRF